MIRMKVSEGGRVVIPVEIRRALQLKEGDTVWWDLVNGQAQLSTRRVQLESARRLFQQYCPPSQHDNVDAFLTQRKAESEQA